MVPPRASSPHRTALTPRYNWITIIVFIVCYTISAIAAAAGSASGAYSFVIIWTMLILLGYLVGGTMVVRQVRF